jgi:co-chaperonin GroES (HSP10)
MAYSDFTLSRTRKELGIQTTEVSGLFDQVPPLIASELLKEMLDRSGRLARLIGTEKAKSEFLIAPILAEIVAQMNDQVSLFSGTEFNIDPEKGLQGFCDFILSQSAEQLEITAPVITIAEAKNDNIKSGIGQCIAEMVGAQIFNQREGRSIAAIQGVVTTGSSWLFMRLIDSQVEIDDREYYINELDKILGILIAPLREC